MIRGGCSRGASSCVLCALVVGETIIVCLLLAATLSIATSQTSPLALVLSLPLPATVSDAIPDLNSVKTKAKKMLL